MLIMCPYLRRRIQIHYGEFHCLKLSNTQNTISVVLALVKTVFFIFFKSKVENNQSTAMVSVEQIGKDKSHPSRLVQFVSKPIRKIVI